MSVVLAFGLFPCFGPVLCLFMFSGWLVWEEKILPNDLKIKNKLEEK